MKPLVFTCILCLMVFSCGCGESSQSPAPASQEVAAKYVEQTQPMNALMVISPYKHNGMWVFDDPSKGLDKEPFVSGVDVMIDRAVADIPNADEGFNMIFSAQPFPGHQFRFDRGEEEGGGYWYSNEQMNTSGWLCPALFKYFDEAPEHIYAQANSK